MNLQVKKITVLDLYFIQNNAILQTEAGENTEEIEVKTDGEEG